MKNLLQLLAAFGPLAVNALGGTAPVVCPPPQYQAITHKPFDEPAVSVSGSDTRGCDNCAISYTETWSVSVQVSVGMNLGLDYKLASAGIGVAVAYTKTNGQEYGQEVGCPAGASCQLLATNHMIEVSGQKVWKKTSNIGSGSVCEDKSEPYTLRLPAVIKTSGGGDAARVTYEGCYWQAPPKWLPGYPYRACPGSPAEKSGWNAQIAVMTAIQKSKKQASKSTTKRAGHGRPQSRSLERDAFASTD